MRGASELKASSFGAPSHKSPALVLSRRVGLVQGSGSRAGCEALAVLLGLGQVNWDGEQ